MKRRSCDPARESGQRESGQRESSQRKSGQRESCGRVSFWRVFCERDRIKGTDGADAGFYETAHGSSNSSSIKSLIT